MPLIVITGASQGIGAAVARAFAAEPDVRLALLARNEANLASVASSCAGLGAEARAFPCDATQDAAVEGAAEAVLAAFGTPDVLVNNAGLFRPGSVLETSAAAFREQMDVNLTSAFLVTQAFLPAMVEAGRGHVFFMGSVASVRAYPGGAAYCVAKHALLGLARATRADTRELGIRVTTLLPGATWTPSWEGVDLPESRFMPADDIARAVVDAWQMSDRTVVEELLIRPQLGDI